MHPLPGRRVRTRVLASVFSVVAAAIVLLGTATPVQPASPPGEAESAGAGVLLRTSVDTRAAAIPVPRNFIGLSVEYPDVLSAVGTESGTGGPNRMFARLLQNITDAGNGPPSLRIGGGTADQAWWNPDGDPKPKGIHYDLDPAWVEALRNFRSLNHLPLIIGLNLAKNRPGIAVDWARAAVNRLGREAIDAFELGNEPELYSSRNYYEDVTVRPSGWGFPGFLREWDLFSRRLKALRSWLPLAGPVSCCAPWDRHLPRFVESLRKRLSLVTFHHFPACNANQPIPMDALLSDFFISAGIARLRPLVDQARARGLRFRLPETVPNACRPDPRYAVALWATDWALALATQRVVGLNFHQMGSSPFQTYYVNDHDPHYEGSVSPLYYAMLLVARAIPNGAKILEAPTRKQQLADGANARAYATVDRDQTVRIVAINKGAGAGEFVIRVARSDRPGTLQRLRGVDMSSREGATLAGQQVILGSRTGNLEGPKVTEEVTPKQGGTYRFTMPGGTAALLVIRHVGR